MKIVYSNFKKSQLKTKISVLKTRKALVGSSIILFDMFVTPQNWHLADYNDHAIIYMMSLWKRTTKHNMHVATHTLCGWNQGSNSYTSSQ
jgi:hypothetical protein